MATSTYGFLSRFMQGRQGPAAQMRGAIDALKGPNGRAGLMTDASELGQVATDAITKPGPLTSVNVPAVGGTQPSGNPSGTTATTGAEGNAGTAGNAGGMPSGNPSGTAATTGAEGNAAAGGNGTVVLPDPGLDAYHWNQDFMTNVLEKPITPEQQAKRTRAAHAVAGIGNLGNVLSAFSNLAFAGKAPSQTLPQVPEAGAAVDKERRRWDTVRKDYVNGKLQGRSMDLKEYLAAAQAKREADKDAWAREYQRRGLDLREKEHDRLIEKMNIDKKLREGKMSLDEARLALQQRKLELDAAYKNGMLSVAQYRAALQEWQTGINEYNARVNAGDRVVTVEETGTGIGGRQETKKKSTTTSKTPSNATIKGNRNGRGNGGNSGTLGWGKKNTENKQKTDW